MKREPKKTVKIKRFRYSLDWFTVDDVECEVGNGFSYEMQFRLGSWYLSSRYFDRETEEWRNDYSKDFQLDSAAEAVIALGNSLAKFSKMHSCDHLTENLTKLLKDVAARIAIREEAEAAQ
ncbi:MULTISPECIES: hypothetical protein [unclassified Enterobacter]|uniref:hypothetical protein n=1 Tax=Enterobacter TaxID=547 RepID=UPI001F1CF4BF|nr:MULTISPECIES: hypothetical protein [unclassified Enterobacter]